MAEDNRGELFLDRRFLGMKKIGRSRSSNGLFLANKNYMVRSAGFFSGNLSALFARLSQSDGDGLLAALDGSTFAALSGFQRAALFPVHGALDAFRGRFAIFAPTGLSIGTGCH